MKKWAIIGILIYIAVLAVYYFNTDTLMFDQEISPVVTPGCGLSGMELAISGASRSLDATFVTYSTDPVECGDTPPGDTAGWPDDLEPWRVENEASANCRVNVASVKEFIRAVIDCPDGCFLSFNTDGGCSNTECDDLSGEYEGYDPWWSEEGEPPRYLHWCRYTRSCTAGPEQINWECKKSLIYDTAIGEWAWDTFTTNKNTNLKRP